MLCYGMQVVVGVTVDTIGRKVKKILELFHAS
jgi:predicted metal-dependent phosphotriesterase family hydrolase